MSVDEAVVLAVLADEVSLAVDVVAVVPEALDVVVVAVTAIAPVMARNVPTLTPAATRRARFAGCGLRRLLMTPPCASNL